MYREWCARGAADSYAMTMSQATIDELLADGAQRASSPAKADTPSSVDAGEPAFSETMPAAEGLRPCRVKTFKFMMKPKKNLNGFV